ncbi:Vps5 C terminal like-domain-containing protein [Umbelopsis sp. PMI_123]|nr:Vps5 C terminal like-domain-containing protein [Umbelopsis sp. PMI_123]
MLQSYSTWREQDVEHSIHIRIDSSDLNRKEPVFWLECSTNLNKYLRKQRRFPRTISDFRRLAVYLTHAYSNAFVPALPKATNPQNLQRWLVIICRNDRLCESEALREFVESDVGFYPHPVKPTPRRRATSLLSTGSGSSDTVEDIDFSFVETKRIIEEFDRQIIICNKKGEMEVNYRRELALAESDLGSEFVSLGAIEREPGLFLVFKNMSKAFNLIADLERSKAASESITILDQMKYQQLNSQAAQEALQVRLKALSEYRECSRLTQTRLRAMERLKFSSSIDHGSVDDAINDLKEAKLSEAHAKQKFEKINSGIKKDICDDYRNDVSEDISRAIVDHVRAQVRIHKKQLQVFESLRPYTTDVASSISSVSIHFNLNNGPDNNPTIY